MKHVALTLVPDALLLAACAGSASAADSSMAIVETLAPTVTSPGVVAFRSPAQVSGLIMPS